MENRTSSWSRSPYTLVAWSVVIVGMAWVLYSVRLLILAALIGIGLGVLLAPLMRLLQERFRIPRALSAVAFVILTAGLFSLVGYSFYALIADQARSFVAGIPELVEEVRTQVETVLGKRMGIPLDFDKIQMEEPLQRAATAAIMSLRLGVEALFLFLLILFIGIYTATRSENYFNGFLSVFPRYRREQIREVGISSAKVLRRWFLSQLIVMALTGATTIVALWILDVEYALLLGVIAGLLEFVPYLGPFASGGLALLVTLGSSPEKFWLVLITFTLVQQIESNIYTPLIMREGIQLPEVHLLIFILVLGSLFGIAGVFIGPPTFAVLRNIYLKVYVPSMEQRDTPPARAKPAEPEPGWRAPLRPQSEDGPRYLV